MKYSYEREEHDLQEKLFKIYDQVEEQDSSDEDWFLVLFCNNLTNMN